MSDSYRAILGAGDLWLLEKRGKCNLFEILTDLGRGVETTLITQQECCELARIGLLHLMDRRRDAQYDTMSEEEITAARNGKPRKIKVVTDNESP